MPFNFSNRRKEEIHCKSFEWSTLTLGVRVRLSCDVANFLLTQKNNVIYYISSFVGKM